VKPENEVSRKFCVIFGGGCVKKEKKKMFRKKVLSLQRIFKERRI